MLLQLAQQSSRPYSLLGVPFDGVHDDGRALFEAPAIALRLATVDVAPEMTRSILDTSNERVGGRS